MFSLVIYVILDAYICHDFLLGSDLLRVATIKLSSNNVVISKDKVEVDDGNVMFESSNVPEIFRIAVFESVNISNKYRSCNIE